MKFIVDRKLYNTETSEEIVRWDNGLGCNDFNWREEILYRTKKGQLWLFGRGGARTEWGDVTSGGTCSSGCGARPIDVEDAMDWAMRCEIDPDDLPEDLLPEEA